ncbi:MAG: exodeoxyribonuclease VII small subunit [Candidatus Eisenbacteria bacterium]
MPPKKTTGTSDAAAMNFEDSMKRLETIVEDLEGGALSLEDSIARYEEGIKLSRRLTQTLGEAEKRIERLVEREGGDVEVEPIELDAPDPGSAASQDELPF